MTEIEKLRQCLKEARAHVHRQEFAGKHEQDRADAVEWIEKWRDTMSSVNDPKNKVPTQNAVAAEILDWVNRNVDEVVRLEPREDYDPAIVGVGYRIDVGLVLVYDSQKIIAMLQRDGSSLEEALEWFEFNTTGAWMGKGTPIFLNSTPWCWQMENGK